MGKVRDSIFDAYKEHIMYDHDIEFNHIINLIKIISINYIIAK